MPSVIVDLSSSMSVFVDKRSSTLSFAESLMNEFSPFGKFIFVRQDPMGSHFRWDSIKKFVFLACTYSNSVHNFDLFSKVKSTVSLYDFIVLQLVMGMAYIFMDFFIKQYTRRIDAPKLLNPLMRGVTFGLFLQTILWALFHSQYMGDTMRYLFSSFLTTPGWSKCGSMLFNPNVTCIPAPEILYKCHEKSKAQLIHFFNTSSHHYYIQSFGDLDRSKLTTKMFVSAIVWVINFFLSTVSDDTLLKIFKLAFLFRTSSTFIILIFLYVSARDTSAVTAFHDIFIVGTGHSIVETAKHIAYMYGIGFLGLHDFSSMSVYTMIDNAVVLYSMLFTVTALIRSWVVRVMFLELTTCVKVDMMIGNHYLIFAILPLSTELFHAHKLYIFYFYLNVGLTTTAYLIMLTLTMAKILHSEFTSVKNIYLVGILCFLGFTISLIITTMPPNDRKLEGLAIGVDVIIFYLGGFKAALIMWIYGVERFSTDIHFWLGFKPTKLWIICWVCLPITCFGFLARKVYLLTQLEDMGLLMSAITWIVVTILTVAFFQIKTIAKFLLQNNLVNVISANKRYGPPDIEDRKRRRIFNETVHLRQCKHNCHLFDEMIDCSHLPLMRTSSGSMLFDAESLTDIYEARPTISKQRPSVAMGVT